MGLTVGIKHGEKYHIVHMYQSWFIFDFEY